MTDLCLQTRPEIPSDHSAIHSVVAAAFGQSNEANLVDRLRAASGFDSRLSIVAERDGCIIGHILFSPIVIESSPRMTPALALAPVAVAPEDQRQGIGSALIRAGLDACRNLGYRIVVVLGHADYYPRFGFQRADAFGIRASFDVNPEAFMVLALTPGALDGVSGIVRYSAAFMESATEPEPGAQATGLGGAPAAG